jgi:hypothetical protein
MQQKVGQGRYGEVYSAQLLMYHILGCAGTDAAEGGPGSVRRGVQCIVINVPYHCAGTDAAEGGSGSVR